jgi:predicted CoA-binding protein
MQKLTLVLGASPNPLRYSYMAVEQLRAHGLPVLALGMREGMIGDVSIQTAWPEVIADLDTLTLYMNPRRQQPLIDQILAWQPRRIIFNPGTENPTLMARASEQGIEVQQACTLVLLSMGVYAEE